MGDELTPEPVDAPPAAPDGRDPNIVAYASVKFPNTGYVIGDLTIGQHTPLDADQLAALEAADATHIVDIDDATGEVI